MKLGQKIKELRKDRNYTQEYVAGKAELSTKWYGKIENDEADVSFSVLDKIANALEVSVVDIITLKDGSVFNNYHQKGNYIAQNYSDLTEKEQIKQLYEGRLEEKETKHEKIIQMYNDRLKEKDEQISFLKGMLQVKE